jgi:heme oxygenase
MSLKELTKDSHTAAEKTPFMKSVFKGTMTQDIWADWTYQKSLFYNAIESSADAAVLLIGMHDLRRTFLLLSDYKAMVKTDTVTYYKKSVLDYYQYIMNLYPNRDRIMAHLYVWHMGDLHGGQMIKKVLPFSHKNLEFDRPDSLKSMIRQQLDDSMAEEANVAFNWAIRMMGEYDEQFNI